MKCLDTIHTKELVLSFILKFMSASVDCRSFFMTFDVPLLFMFVRWFIAPYTLNGNGDEIIIFSYH